MFIANKLIKLEKAVAEKKIVRLSKWDFKGLKVPYSNHDTMCNALKIIGAKVTSTILPWTVIYFEVRKTFCMVTSLPDIALEYSIFVISTRCSASVESCCQNSLYYFLKNWLWFHLLIKNHSIHSAIRFLKHAFACCTFMDGHFDTFSRISRSY